MWICEDVSDIKQGLDGTNYSSCDEEGDDVDLEFEDPNVGSECTIDSRDKHEHGTQTHPLDGTWISKKRLRACRDSGVVGPHQKPNLKVLGGST